MLDTRKMIRFSIKESKNLLSDIFTPVNQREGFRNGQSPIVPIYFYRYIGIKENETTYYSELKELDRKLTDFKNLYLKFLNSVPLTSYNDLVLKTKSIWEKYNPILPGQKNQLLNDIRQADIYPKINDSLNRVSVIERFIDLIDLYFNNESSINISKVKSFCLKLLGWINEYIPKVITDFNLNTTNNVINPKVLFYGDIKKHEIYFLTYLSTLGIDVLYINPNTDAAFNNSGKLQEYSKVLSLHKIGELKKFPSYTGGTNSSVSSNRRIEQECQNTILDLNNKDTVLVSLKASNNPFEDIFTPLNHRAGYINSSTPFAPIYFYRYIGTDKKDEEYLNEVFNLDKKLSTLNNLYLKFVGLIPLIPNQELVKKTQHIWTEIKDFNNSKQDLLIHKLVQSKAFPDLKSELLNSTIIKNFKLVLDLYLKHEKSINLSKVKNFSLKLLMWINEYSVKALRGVNYQNATGAIKNPKVLYYGKIKQQEIYFLILMSKMGFDVLYLNSFSDETFNIIDKTETHSKSLHFSNKFAIKEFPKEEQNVRFETNAFKASERISRVIHNEEDGVYKHWQFEEYKTSHVTLKSTHDELKILWNEESRMRTGFKISNGTVYIPNLFAKISGTYNDLNLYWDEINEFRTAEHVILFDSVPFTKTSFRQSDLYTSSFLVNDKGIDKKRLRGHQIYKYSYLKTALQDTIIDKINKLFVSDMLKTTMTKEFKLKILMTLMSLDDKILKLIQRFDYPFKVPKIMIYDNNESMFNDEDSIVLAFLNLLGFDILLLTPTGYNNIEQKIYSKYFDTHKLETIKFDLALPDFNSLNVRKAKSFLGNLFNKTK